MTLDQVLHRRRVLGSAAAATTTTTTGVLASHCTPFNLPSNGVIAFDSTSSTTIRTNVVFKPECTATALGAFDPTDPSSITDLRDPFFASTIVQTYVIAAATVLSYTLVIMLLITPRTFFVGGPGGGGGLLGGRGLISGASGRTSVVGVGSRPWLQKVATLTVAISLTIATVDTFKVASQQYDLGYMSATKLRNEVAGGKLIKAVRVISDTFLWLAQVQTLIRLFPRHKEKVIIKWIGSALIICDTVFSILNSFVFVRTHSKDIDAIPTISYLFQLALSLLYAAWVLYYAFTKRRYAFYHYKMRNICLVALLALIAVLIPIIFFVLDISNPNLAGWGDYVRWVGAAAASVVVWEWVERIEALERDDRKDGVLGREVFDGDEMLDITPPGGSAWDIHPIHPRGGNHGIDHAHASALASAGPRWGQTTRTAMRTFRPSRLNGRTMPGGATTSDDRAAPGDRFLMSGAHTPTPTPPPVTASPVSRNETSSADSTLYAIHHHPVVAVPVPTAPAPHSFSNSLSLSSDRSVSGGPESDSGPGPASPEARAGEGVDASTQSSPTSQGPTERSGTSAPRRAATSSPSSPSHSGRMSSPRPSLRSNLATAVGRSDAAGRRRDLKSRLREVVTSQSDRTQTRGNDVPLPVMVIPAPSRGQTWSPEALLASANASAQGRGTLLGSPVPTSDLSGPATEAGDPRPGGPAATSATEPLEPRANTVSPNRHLAGVSPKGMAVISEDRPDDDNHG